MDKAIAGKLRAYGDIIYHSMIRSQARRKILLDLKRNGPGNTTDLSTRTGYHYSNTRGALVGNGEKYDSELSLVTTGLANADPGTKEIIYSLTPTGEEVANIVEQIWDN
ncbi:helix-turn-helix domain-containing protein [Methanocella arvoryzae]|uniref:helix-turn-helix domain-containing protein n=1 Tax=Methanocella arvoryzae TaxID=1175445 RepID=UPI000324F727|nr:archaellum operon transcriptional activator EarA family protein [Methanocella arvoryzae]